MGSPLGPPWCSPARPRSHGPAPPTQPRPGTSPSASPQGQQCLFLDVWFPSADVRDPLSLTQDLNTRPGTDAVCTGMLLPRSGVGYGHPAPRSSSGCSHPAAKGCSGLRCPSRGRTPGIDSNETLLCQCLLREGPWILLKRKSDRQGEAAVLERGWSEAARGVWGLGAAASPSRMFPCVSHTWCATSPLGLSARRPLQRGLPLSQAWQPGARSPGARRGGSPGGCRRLPRGSPASRAARAPGRVEPPPSPASCGPRLLSVRDASSLWGRQALELGSYPTHLHLTWLPPQRPHFHTRSRRDVLGVHEALG